MSRLIAGGSAMQCIQRTTIVVVLFLAAGTTLAQQTIYVNGTTGNDDWDGLCEEWDGGTCGPKATIQACINAATNGDTVLVADGTYTGPLNKNLDFNGRAITVLSATRSSAYTCRPLRSVRRSSPSNCGCGSVIPTSSIWKPWRRRRTRTPGPTSSRSSSPGSSRRCTRVTS